MNVLLMLKRVKDLSPPQRQVVDYILENPLLVCNLGIVELAQRTYTSTGTVMRVLRKLKVDSYIDFRFLLSCDLNEFLAANNICVANMPIEKADSMEAIIDKVSTNNARAALDAKKINEYDTFKQVVAMMNAANQFDFYGSDSSNLIACDARIKAMRLGIPATALSYFSEMAVLSKTCDRHHLAFFISYTGRTIDTIRIAENIRRRGIPSVSITGLSQNPLIELCDINLFVDSVESVYRIGGMNSRISTLNVLDILFACFMNENFDAMAEIIGKTFVDDHLKK